MDIDHERGDHLSYCGNGEKAQFFEHVCSFGIDDLEQRRHHLTDIEKGLTIADCSEETLITLPSAFLIRWTRYLAKRDFLFADNNCQIPAIRFELQALLILAILVRT